MDEFAIVIMLKDKATGFLEKELGSYKIDGNEDLILNVYAEEGNDGYICRMKILADKELEDWEFEAVYDYYDGEVFLDEILSFREVEDCFNPTWEISFPYNDGVNFMESKLNKLLKIHADELSHVYEEIKDKENEYTQI